MPTCEWVGINEDEVCGEEATHRVSFRSQDDMPIIFPERKHCDAHTRDFEKMITRNYKGRRGVLRIDEIATGKIHETLMSTTL